MGFNNTVVDYPKDKCVHQLFEEQVEKTPDKFAVIACDKTLTYSELNEEANRIAHALINMGINVGDIVAFSLSRKSCIVSTIIGILKSGAAYLPIDPVYPKERIEEMLLDSCAKCYITDTSIDAFVDNNNTQNLETRVKSTDLCYCLFTSGSTGKPKGVLVKHYNLVNFCCDINSNAFISFLSQNCSTILSSTSVIFDISIFEIFTALFHNKTIVFANEKEIVDANQLAALIVKHRVDCVLTTPTKISLYLLSDSFKNSLKRIKGIMIGAEKLTDSLCNYIRSISSCRIFNGYGPTETTIGVAFCDTEKYGSSIGSPVANTQIYIVDKYLKPMPIGVTGELCIAGDSVGAGYLNCPELTAERFIDNPFDYGKLYKTGDLAYWREDGNIVYVGRNDYQVKIRGLRIELGEIENAISSIEGVSQSVVVVRKNNEGRQLICAFYTGDVLDAREIRTIIGSKLPKYMLPNIITHIGEMPLTTSGKINRNLLPEVDLYNISIETEFVMPKTEMEKALCRIIEEILNTSPIGANDDFFDCGGDSLKAIELVSKAHSEGIYFNMQNIFDYPTVRGLCECIEYGDKQTVSYDDVDFASVNTVLKKNTIKNISTPENSEVGNVLLTGSTGYLGIHILADFLDNDTGNAYCIVRGKDNADSEKRLFELLRFYFGDKYSGCSRIKVYCGDLKDDRFGLSKDDYTYLQNEADMVINCAASVKHYGSYRYFYEMNVENTKRLINFCMESNAKLIHTSTLSVSGNSFGDQFDGYISDQELHFYESNLYIGQPLDNVYARSKFEAEKAVLEAIANGLQANIMRIGNLTNRTDGVFQRNYESNAFLKRVKAVIDMGVIPDYLLDYVYLEFTPIDEAVRAILSIVRHFDPEQTVFHINSTKVVYLDRFIEYIRKIGINLEIVSGKKFTEMLRQAAKDAGTEYIFETFINDMNNEDKLVYDSNIRIENDFTEEYLKNLGFEWPDIGIEYLKNYFNYFREIGYIQ